MLDGGPGNNTVIPGGAALLANFMASTFVPAAGGHGATPIADPQSGQQPVLAVPQHA